MDSARSQGCVKALPRPQPTSSVQRKARWHWKVTLHLSLPLLPWHRSALCLYALFLRTTFSLYEFVLNISYKQNHTTWHFQFLSLGVVLSEFISVRSCRIIFVLILRFLSIFCVYECWPEWMSVYYGACSAQGCPKRAMDALGLELQTPGSFHWVLETEPRSL